MVEYDISQTTTLNTVISNYSVSPKSLDNAGGITENYYDNLNFKKWFGYYSQIPELKSAINSFAIWVLGQGYEADIETKILLEGVNGWGEDTFLSILVNQFIIALVNGDSYAEIIRDEEGELLNVKPLDPSTMRIVCNKGGKIIRYEQRNKLEIQTYKINEIFHLCNNRLGDSIHGDSFIESVQWVIDARNEALVDKRRSMHLSTIRVIEVEEDIPGKMAQLKSDYKEAIEKGYVLLLPKGTGDIKDLAPPVTEHIAWIRYLEDFYYQALGVPKVILGGTADNTEASAKVSVIVYEPVFTSRIIEIQEQIWNQLFKKITINKQPSLMDNMQTDEKANTGQTKLEYQGEQ